MPASILRRSLSVGGRVSVVFFLTATSVAHACLWDWDTLQMERRLFPGTLEMITGKFVRHSRAYYEWRIQDRTKRMRSPGEDPDLADDLAVAYSKLGRHVEGIALLEQVLAVHPDRYETLANLGTIHMLAGDLKTGKDFIDRAIVINPDAHFGREKYQSFLANYFLTERKSPHPASQWPGIGYPKGQYHGFAKFVLGKRGHGDNLWIDENSQQADSVKTELAAAQKGVLGMMHFANYDSPILLESLGDLLIAWPGNRDDAVQLAARAYYRVSQVSDDKATKDEFKMAAANLLYGHLDYINHRRADAADKDKEWFDSDLEKLSADLNRELAEGRAFAESIAADERRWIAAGVNVDEAFAAKYYDSLESTIDDAKKTLDAEPRDVRTGPFQDAINRALVTIAAAVTGFVAIVWGARFAYRRIRSRAR